MIIQFEVVIDSDELDISAIEIMHDINYIIRDYLNQQKLSATVAAKEIKNE